MIGNTLIFAEINFTKHEVAPDFQAGTDLELVDIDGDNDLDVVASSYNEEVSWFENDGNQNFTGHDVSVGFIGTRFVVAKDKNGNPLDMDNDGDVDIIAAGMEINKVSWFENDGNENFTERLICDNFSAAHTIDVVDIDDDGDFDVLCSGFDSNELLLMKNDGSNYNFERITLANDFLAGTFINAGKIDNDDLIDFVAIKYGNNYKISWFKQTTNPEEPFIETVFDQSFLGGHTTLLRDFDGDNDLDILGSAYNSDKYAWWKNDGNGGFTKIDITGQYDGAIWLDMVDLDLDGDNDLIGAAENAGDVLWWENLGEEELAAPRIIENNLGRVYCVYPADIDGDHDFDLVAIGNTGNKILWWENSFYSANISANILSGHIPLEVEFSDESYFYQEIISRTWDFNNDGVIDSEAANPIYTFNEPGIYSIKYRAITEDEEYSFELVDYITVFNGESALEFNGIDSKVNCTPDEETNLNETLTIEAWVKPAGWGKMDRGNVIDKKNFAIHLNKSYPGMPDSSYVFYLKDENDNISKYYTEVGTVRFDEWQHLAVSFDYSAEEAVKFYVNGIKQNLTEDIGGTGKIKDNIDINLVIGNNTYGSIAFDGVIDEVRLWDIVRSHGDILSTVNGLLTGEEDGLVGYWRMNEAGGESLTDFAGGNNGGAISNCPWVNGASFDVNSISDNDISQKLSPRVYPNPFNPNVTISYDLAEDSVVKIEIFNALGQRIRNLSNSYENAGENKEILWDGKNDFGNNIASGVYFYKISTSENQATGRMLLVK